MKLETLTRYGICFLLFANPQLELIAGSSATFSILASQENSSPFFESDARD